MAHLYHSSTDASCASCMTSVSQYMQQCMRCPESNMAKRLLPSALLLLSLLHATTLVIAQTEYASPATPTVPIVSASSPWLTTTKPAVTGSAAAGKPPVTMPKFPAYFAEAKIAHATLGAVAFLFVFPLGGILVKVWPHRHIVWIHAGIQMFGLAVYIASAGLGIWMGTLLHTLDQYHAVLGLMVLAFLVIQPLLKLHWIHAAIPRVAFFMHIHLWLGRISLALGIIDGGLGFRLSGMLRGPKWPEGWKIAYGVLGGIVWIVYVGVCIVWVELKKVPRAAPVSSGAPPEEMLALADQDSRDNSQERLKTGVTVETVSAVDSDVESGKLEGSPKRPARGGGL